MQSLFAQVTCKIDSHNSEQHERNQIGEITTLTNFENISERANARLMPVDNEINVNVHKMKAKDVIKLFSTSFSSLLSCLSMPILQMPLFFDWSSVDVIFVKALFVSYKLTTIMVEQKPILGMTLEWCWTRPLLSRAWWRLNCGQVCASKHVDEAVLGGKLPAGKGVDSLLSWHSFVLHFVRRGTVTVSPNQIILYQQKNI